MTSKPGLRSRARSVPPRCGSAIRRSRGGRAATGPTSASTASPRTRSTSRSGCVRAFAPGSGPRLHRHQEDDEDEDTDEDGRDEDERADPREQLRLRALGGDPAPRRAQLSADVTEPGKRDPRPEQEAEPDERLAPLPPAVLDEGDPGGDGDERGREENPRCDPVR